MRVVIINDASLARGGATGLALLQAKLLRDKGIDTVFVAGDAGENDALRQSGVRVCSAGSAPLLKSSAAVAATRGLYNRGVSALVDRVIAAEDGPDTVYHVHSWSKTLTAAVFAPLRKVSTRCFIHAHDFFLACPNGGFMDYRAMEPCHRRPLSVACLATNCDKRSYAQKAWRVSRQLVLRRTLPRSLPWAGILLIHPGQAPFLAQSGYGAQPLVTLRNPATALSPTRIRAERNEGMVFIGRVEAEKGIEDLLTAATTADVPLTVVGEGPLRRQLERANPGVRFTGWQDRAGLLEAARTARALVMPSRYPEPFGLVAAEASLAGLPVLVSDTALLAPEIADAGIGWRCNTREPAAFGAALRDIAALPADRIAEISRRAARGEAGLSTTPSAWIDALLELYATAISSV